MATKPPELAGISKIKESVSVCAVLDGESRWLSTIGEAIGPFKLVAIDLETGSADFERDGETTRVWLRNALVKGAERQEVPDGSASPLDILLGAMKKKAVFVGFGELSEQEKEGILMAQLNHILNFPEYNPDKRRELLSRKLNQERLISIGPKGISEKEAAALGISPEKAAEMNQMHRMGPALRKLSKEEGKPVSLEID